MQKRGLAHLHFPPLDSREHRKSYTSCWCLLAKKHTKSEKRGRERFQVERERRGESLTWFWTSATGFQAPWEVVVPHKKSAQIRGLERFRVHGAWTHLIWFRSFPSPCLDPQMPRRILEAHADSLRQIKKWKMKIKSTKNLGNMGLSVLLHVWIRSPGANMHLRSLSLIFLRWYPEMSACWSSPGVGTPVTRAERVRERFWCCGSSSVF